ncbi:MerR family transcriptional regulator [Bifidobacterium aquikefiricola]|uniref:MerR family transcriptional regulator n=1 Tax=Bifidobacterium aquikefiricola TaxID=3059038 RepID=A0AB39U6G2_9BIFI
MTGYSIGEVAQIMGLSTSAIRFYDRKGLLPFVHRDSAGRRVFQQDDLNFIEAICCLKKSGVPIKDIGHFVRLCMQGDATLHERYDYLDGEERALEGRIAELQGQLDFLRYKKWYYKTSIEAGTESIHMDPQTGHVAADIKEQYRSELERCEDIRQLTQLGGHQAAARDDVPSVMPIGQQVNRSIDSSHDADQRFRSPAHIPLCRIVRYG